MTTSSTRSDGVTHADISENSFVPDALTSLRMVALPFILSRLWVALFAYWGHSQRPFLKPVHGGWAGVENWWLNPWTTYDSERFIKVAERGYDVATSVSFPLYSVLLTPFRGDAIAMAAWGVLLSNLAFWCALLVLLRLTARDFNLPMAKAAVWVLAFFPSSVIFSAVYAESVFLLFVVLTWWNARNGKWGRAALWSLLAGLTRNSGPILTAALLVEFAMQWRHARDEKRSLSPWAALSPIAPLAAFAGFQIFLRYDLGRGDLVLAQAHTLGRDWMLPWTSIWNETLSILHGTRDTTTLINYWATITALILIVAYWRRSLSYTIFLSGVVLSFLTFGLTFPPFTTGAVRYLAVVFPMQQRLAMWALSLMRRPIARLSIVALGLTACGIVAFEFGKKYYLF